MFRVPLVSFRFLFFSCLLLFTLLRAAHVTILSGFLMDGVICCNVFIVESFVFVLH